MPPYVDRMGLCVVENTKDPQRSPELKAQAWAKVDKHLHIFLLELYIVNVLGPKLFTGGGPIQYCPWVTKIRSN